MANADHGIELRLTKSDCYPGDVVELHARMSRADFAEFDLKLPHNDALHLVAQQNKPVRYRDGVYSQHSTWIMQPMKPGTIELKGIIAVLKQGETIIEIELPIQTLTVRGHGVTEDTFTPEPLPPAQSYGTSHFRIFLVSLAVGGVLLLIIIFRKTPNVSEAITETQPTLEELRVSLESGDVPTTLIEQLLADKDTSMPSPTREILERAVYGQSMDADVLLAQLTGKELS